MTNPLNNRIVTFGRRPVEMVFGNRAFVDGRVMLGKGANGWFAIKTHFLLPPSSLVSEFTARVRRLGGPGRVGLGGHPPGGVSHSAGAGADALNGWREFVVDATWMRSLGCYEWTISGRSFSERIVLQAIPFHR